MSTATRIRPRGPNRMVVALPIHHTVRLDIAAQIVPTATLATQISNTSERSMSAR